MGPRIQVVGDGVRIQVRVQPRASRTALAGELGDAWKVRVAAPPVDGAANSELVRFLADLVGVPKSSVRVIRGRRSRAKTVEIAGVEPGQVRVALDEASS